MKQNGKIFITAFLVTGIFLGLLAFLTVADRNTKTVSGMMAHELLFDFRKTGPYEAEVTVFNECYRVSLAFLDVPLRLWRGGLQIDRALAAPLRDAAAGALYLHGPWLTSLARGAERLLREALA